MSEISGFEKDEKGVHGIAAAWSLSSDLHIIIMAPDMNKLAKAFDKLGCEPLNESLCKFVIGEDTGKLDKPQTISFKNDLIDYWYYFPEPSKTCQMFNPSQLRLHMELSGCKHSIQLGKAKERTKNECKLLLREHKFDRTTISEVSIWTDDIPF